ncbi:50S ribosomal protein L32e [Candidatus Bathyarchaeota archaeon]|jgi:large subunit ribosomal protein L32e|nr:50S ribosomal protein L32e [Candidatus Bathyarchaeota archaeon]
MNEKEKKRLLKIRKNIDKKRPHFKRFESWRFKRIPDQWRKPTGIDNKMRRELAGWPKTVKVGYRGPSAVRGLHPSGYEEVLVWNPKDLNDINPDKQVVRIGGSVGGRKKELINTKAEELNIHVLNPGRQEPIFEEFEALEDDEIDEFEELDEQAEETEE